MNNLFQGNLVRLAADEPKTVADAQSRWARNTTFHRLLDTDPQRLFSVKNVEKELEQAYEKMAKGGLPDGFFFDIHAREDDRLIGFAGLWGPEWNHGDTLVSIGLGEPEYWGKGYGTDAMRLVLQYAFTELNLYRVTLFVFAYNARAIRSYEKAGFKHEGIMRQLFQRDGERHDALVMGVLREEWLAENSKGDL